MSGLVGWIDFRHDLGTQESVIHAMTNTMQSRGPDAKGIWISRNAALGHRALTVSGLPAEQPLQERIGTETVAVAVAGDIYNLPELAREIEGAGGLLKTGGSPEVLLQAYLLWGDRFVDRVNGVFGFAIWDGRTQKVLLGRDRLGIKPLYYYEYPGGILFASVPKGIMANPRFKARLDLHALPIALQPRLAMPGETPLAGLREVPPGHVLTYAESGLTRRRYWRLTSEPHHDSFDDTARRVRDLLDDVVGRQLTSAGPLSAMLSGGVDSTSIAALAVRRLRQDDADRTLDTYCIQFESDPAHFVATELRPDVDAPYAAAAADFIGSRHHTLTATVHDLLDVVRATRSARDLPGWGQFDASMYLLFRQIRNSSAVALTGEAADEVFGGYPYFFKQDVVERARFPWLGDGPRLSRYLSPELTALIKPEEDERARYSQLMSDVPRLPGEDAENARMREIFYLGLSGPLAVILDRKERMSASLGLDVRVPFCDHRLVEYAWNVPWAMKSKGGVKGLLKAAMADVLPPGTVNRKKSAYPHVQNPSYDRTLIREALWIVNDKASPLAGLFDTAGMNGLIRQISANAIRSELPGGSNQAALLIQLVELHNWVHEYGVSLG
ncbi:asparagine synthase (glutamine-hydrolyzing) [Streptosporangium carneum]|uniref:asparagine synthase (glutamine-hydrolyzing) n=1 Tax=Streptosporangium carneum TaxID=47481 RepID=A0A9W6I654_9ACTN|nr:asparagine synthase (glutamine-hydrolyzing) [Streptosporangium carneum]GLK12780.1 asparagine synthetase B [Streptosporangium carneum]